MCFLEELEINIVSFLFFILVQDGVNIVSLLFFILVQDAVNILSSLSLFYKFKMLLILYRPCS